ncbi:MAG: hypothetical protein AB7R89_13715 [Dehalococcoidia bacterium]
MAAYQAFRNYGTEPIAQDGRYARLYSWWDGSWRRQYEASQTRSRSSDDPVLYRGTRQFWRQSRAIVSLYAQLVYQGSLSRDGGTLPDGTRGAIPIDPMTGDERLDTQLLAAISELFAIWNWEQFMTFRPKMGAMLGDYLTEIIDDEDRGITLFDFVWPGYVTDLDLDQLGNVKRYAIERVITVQESKAFGRDIKGETYRFRKEVDGRGFWLFKNDKPHAYPELGFPEAEVENPYGFCPAIWDRHEIVPGNRGLSAIDATYNQTIELNGILSHALDGLAKKFAAPVGVVGRTTRRRNITLPGGLSAGANPTAEEIDAAAREVRENLNLIDLNEGGQFVEVPFDLGQTVQTLQLVMDSILAENPEARYAQEILTMTQATGPAIERLLGPIASPVRAARVNYDAQTRKLLQMAIAIMGYRLQRSDYPSDVVNARPDRYAPFQGFDLESFGQGHLDFAIPSRPVFPETIDERVARLVLVGQVIDTGDPWLMAEAGIPEEEVQRMIADRDRARQQELAAFSVAGAGGAQQEEDQTNA